ncbi:Rab interacting lysosomal protein [Penicillium digitatum]|uniref:Uncharacterized protein n=3 Tax=Penicillium digitatum TaxID=36651 RepID=K9FVG0_PEND2|nr:hypothetical protein PDIP_22830 [Penicillium digitatum Pd1]EKV05061.1 hypothetical protein PDIG_85170 [Penicillium digitatum PHI26]EKV19621.1 hypothetical protein PDIP_22830 [Penicillium digitatum Pd1]QQK45052.1 Rab interacting lysosomal protein [Penicillium digitatum]
MSGNYNYPRASSSSSSSSSRYTSRTTRPDERPEILRLQHLRNFVSERNRSGAHNAYNATLALETINREVAEHSLDRVRDRINFEQAEADVDRQIQLQFETAGPTEPVRGIWINQLHSERARTSLSPESNSVHYRLPWQTLRPPSPDGSLSRSPSPMPPSGQSGRDGQGRMKRRKLDTDDHREEFRGFNYGQYGQVVPGMLQMEIASCDGGSYDPDSACSRPENVLDNNTSVYSTKEARCNLVLCHRGEAPFCLKKIVIRAPQGGFDAPIQEGMVFVAMTSDELLARTAQYQIQYSNSRYRRTGRRSGMQPSQEYLTGFRPPLQLLERTILMSPHSVAVPHTAEDPQAQFRIITEYDENNEDSGDDDNWRSALLERTQAEQTEDPLSDTDESPSDEEDPSSRHPRRRQVESERLGALSRVSEQRLRHTPSLVHPNPPAEPVHATAEVLKPHARFFIEREKSMVTIKFDPPPSGRFILIKLWSPRAHGNIDIERIIAHGYAGPRFFPSIAAR